MRPQKKSNQRLPAAGTRFSQKCGSHDTPRAPADLPPIRLTAPRFPDHVPIRAGPRRMCRNPGAGLSAPDCVAAPHVDPFWASNMDPTDALNSKMDCGTYSARDGVNLGAD